MQDGNTRKMAATCKGEHEAWERKIVRIPGNLTCPNSQKLQVLLTKLNTHGDSLYFLQIFFKISKAIKLCFCQNEMINVFLKTL